MPVAKIYLPYYMVEPLEAGGGRRFYGEAHLSLLTDWYRILVLATPQRLPFEKIPLGAPVLEPLADPSEYASRIEEALERAMSEYSSKPAFKIGGVRGLLKLLYDGLRGRKAGAGPELEARLIINYAVEVLGVEPGEKLRAYPETFWLPVELEFRGERIMGARIISPSKTIEYPLLVKFAMIDGRVRRALLKAAVEGWKAL